MGGRTGEWLVKRVDALGVEGRKRRGLPWLRLSKE